MLRLPIFGAIVAVGFAMSASAEVPARAQAHEMPLDGDWTGAITPGPLKLRLVFHFETKNGVTSGELTSLDQGGTKIPFSAVTRNNASIDVTIAAIGGDYQGALSPDAQSISGTWSQGGQSLPLTLTKQAPGSSALDLKRPQEPHPPYPYRSEDVVYDGSGGIKLAGTLTLPGGKGPFATAILIAGSGPHNRDEALMGHKPFLVLADYLTRHGIAVLRSDKRGIGQSGGAYATATSQDFADDVESAIAYLKSRPEIDHARVGLVGHSEGGLIAPMVAAKDRSVVFIVLMAGPGMKGDELLPLQGKLVGLAMGRTEEQADAIASFDRGLYAAMAPAKTTEAAAADANAYLAKAAAASPQYAEQIKAVDKTVPLLASPWFRFFLSYDPLPTLKQVKCPVLAIDGEKDLQVPAKENLTLIRTALAGNPDVQVIELPGLNHLFQTARTGALTEYGEIEETMSPKALELVTDWIVKHTQGRP
jgi:hypothetical protein